MKSVKIILALLPTLLFIILAQSCKKTPIETETYRVHKSYATLNNNYSGVDENDGILWFDDEETLKAAMDQLEANYEIWNDAFEQEYAELDDDDFNETAESENFQEEQAMLDFEVQFNYTSLRTIIAAQQEEWLATIPWDENNEPDDHYVQDYILRTFLNEYGEIGIGNSVYIVFEEEVFEVTDGDMQTVEGIRDDREEYREEENVVVHDYGQGEGKIACKNWEFAKEHPGQGGTYHFKTKLSFRNYPWYSVVVAKSKAYKNKKRHKTYQIVQIYGDVYNPGCSLSDTAGGSKDKRRKKVKVRDSKWGGTGIRSKDKSVKSSHYTYGVTQGMEI